MKQPSLFEQLRMLTAMNYVARCVHALVELAVADAIAADAVHVAALARTVGAHPEILERMLRLTSPYGLFSVEHQLVSHTDMSRLLRADHPSSLRDFVRMIGLRVNWRAAEGLPHALRTGEAPMSLHEPDGVWAHYAAHPDDARVFDASMSSRASLMLPAIQRAYDFSQFRTVADIGGGKGHLLKTILDGAPAVTGILFDLPHVVSAAREADPHPRVQYVAGDFFTAELPEADAYILMEILHDWPDEAAERIVAAIRRAVPTGALLLLMEIVPADESTPQWATTLDIVMLAHFGGKQRTRAEYDALLAKNHFSIRRDIPTNAGITIFEATAI